MFEKHPNISNIKIMVKLRCENFTSFQFGNSSWFSLDDGQTETSGNIDQTEVPVYSSTYTPVWVMSLSAVRSRIHIFTISDPL